MLFILQKQASKFEKQAKDRWFNQKTSPECISRKIQQNKKQQKNK